MVKIENLTMKFQENVILDNINIEIKNGEIIAFTGLINSGKSCLLKQINGLISPTEGHVIVDRVNVIQSPRQAYDLGIVSSYELDNINDNLPIFDNVFMSNNVKKISFFSFFNIGKALQLTRDYFSQFDLTIDPKEMTSTLKLEEKYILNIIRTLHCEGEVFIFDTVTDNLSEKQFKTFKEACLKLKKANKIIIFVSNNYNQIFELCDRIAILRNGKLVKDFATEETNISTIFDLMNNTQYSINNVVINRINSNSRIYRNLDDFSIVVCNLLNNFTNSKESFFYYKDENFINKLICTNESSENSIKKKIDENIKFIIPDNSTENDDAQKNQPLFQFKATINYVVFPLNKNDHLLGYVGVAVSKKSLTENRETINTILEEFSTIFFNKREDIINRISKENRKMEVIQMKKEMELAKHIQTAILPKLANIDIPGYTISAFMRPADEVGGDYYDIITSPENDFWINIGDVAGHGVTAGLIMLMLQTSTNSIINAIPDVSPKDLTIINNKVIFDNIQNRLLLDQFITTCFIKFNQSGFFQYSGAHEDILIYRFATQNVEVVRTCGIWLGLVKDITTLTFQKSFNLYQNDILLIFTDGVIEVQNNELEQYDMNRLQRFLKNYGGETPETISEKLIAELDAFRDEQKDDITFLILKKN